MTRLKDCLLVLLGLLIVSACGGAVADDPVKTVRPASVVALGGSDGKGQPVMRVEADCQSATLPLLSWDTEGGDRAKCNLLLRRHFAETAHGEGVGQSDRRREEQRTPTECSFAWPPRGRTSTGRFEPPTAG